MENYIARQPIVGRNGNVVAYELLYYQDNGSSYNAHDASTA